MDGEAQRRDISPVGIRAVLSTREIAMGYAAPIECPISFGPFRLFPGQRLLLEGEKQIRLGSRALEILVALVERAGELVTKDELIARVWPNTVVVEDNLTVHVAALRRALGDGTGGKRYLVTVPGRGYCFVARVTRQHAAAARHQASPIKQSHNLPMSLTRLIGRADVVSHLGQQLRYRRLLTIVGTGGIGKTSVALAVAAQQIANFESGVWLVDLVAIGGGDLVPTALAAVLGLEICLNNPLPGLIAALRDRRMLIVLDNCEHVIDSAAHFAVAMLRGAPGVHILATSREPLRVEGEHLHRLLPLESPSVPASECPAGLSAFPAVQLFVERATASFDGFEFDDSDMLAATNICQKLDGVPLAIEFAAARVGALGVGGLASRLEDRLRFLTKGRRTAVARHQTMRATLDWSYGLLSEIEQKVLRRLAVFPGGFTLRAAGAVVADPDDVESDIAVQVLELAAKSLVTADVRAAEPRFRLFETTRAYALSKLAESGERDKVTRRHAEYYRTLLEAPGRALSPGNDWPNAFAAETDNCRAALAWAFCPEGDASVAQTNPNG